MWNTVFHLRCNDPSPVELHKLRDFEAGVVDLVGALDGERGGDLLAPAGDHIVVPDVGTETDSLFDKPTVTECQSGSQTVRINLICLAD